MAGDQQKTELALQSMRLALQAIANYGDCLHTRDTRGLLRMLQGRN